MGERNKVVSATINSLHESPLMLLTRPNERLVMKTSEWISVAFLMWVILSWITHVVVCIKTASYWFLIAGAIMFPIAWIHGTGVWFGIW